MIRFSTLFRRGLPCLPYLLAAGAAALAVNVASAALTTPSDPTLPFNWSRPADETQAVTDQTTYQMWDVLKTVSGPNAPDVEQINSIGVADLFDSAAPGSGGFITGGGNLYSFSGVVEPRVIVPSYNLTGQVLNVLVQARVLGQDIDTADVTVNGTLISTLANYSYQELSRSSAAQGNTVDHAWTFSLPSDLAQFTLDWGWGVSSASLDQLSVDTKVLPVPEPGAAALLGIGGAGLGLIFHRRRRRGALLTR